MTFKEKKEEVLNKVSIPQYFYKIIVPQMGSYYDNYPVDFDSKIVVCCPLHDEDTPSCRYYEDTSSFYCFGCGKGGTVINLHRYFTEKINGKKPDELEAVNFLYNYFIFGNEESTSFVNNTKILTKKQNSDAEVVRLNLYRNNLEKAITFDSTISLEVKKEFWKLFDKIDVLISLDKISCADAKKELSDTVSRLIK